MMFALSATIGLSLMLLTKGQSDLLISQDRSHHRLCVHTATEYEKCIYTVQAAQNRSLPLKLECVRRESENDCIRSVSVGDTDMVVLDEHGYKDARDNLRPVIYERDDDNDTVYVAVTSRDITVVQLAEAVIDVDVSDHRALHAAILFNMRRGHNVCRILNPAAAASKPKVRIVAYNEYVPRPNDILICADLTYSETDDADCNVDAWLQRAIFVHQQTELGVVVDILQNFDIILNAFGPNAVQDDGPDGDRNFNFFSTFAGSDNVIFGNNTIAFDLWPTLRNGVDEYTFDHLHCHTEHQQHDDSQLD